MISFYISHETRTPTPARMANDVRYLPYTSDVCIFIVLFLSSTNLALSVANSVWIIITVRRKINWKFENIRNWNIALSIAPNRLSNESSSKIKMIRSLIFHFAKYYHSSHVNSSKARGTTGGTKIPKKFPNCYSIRTARIASFLRAGPFSLSLRKRKAGDSSSSIK